MTRVRKLLMATSALALASAGAIAKGPYVPPFDAIMIGTGLAQAHVGTNAALLSYTSNFMQALASVATPTRMRRDGFYTAGDGGAAEYSYSATACKTPDNGAQVPAASGGCWMMDPAAIPPDIRQWGAQVGNLDSTAMVNAALAANAAPKLRVNGLYTISAALVNNNGAMIEGGSKGSSGFFQNTLTADIFDFNFGGGLAHLILDYNGIPTGGRAISASGGNAIFYDFVINHAYVGIDVSGVANQFHDFQVLNYGLIGFYGHDTNDNYASHFILNAGNATNGLRGGIRLFNQAEAFFFDHGEVLNGAFSLTTDATAFTNTKRPAYDRFNTVFFDSAAQGSQINNMSESSFIGCWFSGGRTDAGYPGLTLGQTDAVSFTDTTFFNNGTHGALVSSQSKRSTFVNVHADSNGVMTAADGLHFQAGASYFSVIGGTAGNTDYPAANQQTGVSIEGGASTGYVVQGVMCGGTDKNACVYDGGSASSKLIQGNY